MKAYKLILELIKHPFSNVKLIMDYDLTHIRYNKYRGYLLESISNECGDEVDVKKEMASFHYQEDADGNFAHD